MKTGSYLLTIPDTHPCCNYEWNAIQVINGACYVGINGFTIRGNASNVTFEEALNQPAGCNNPGGLPLSEYNGNGIQTHGVSPFSTGYPHHIRIVNNTICECCGSGISSVQSDYLTIENNLLYDNCRYNVFGNSAISLYQNWNLDSNTAGYRMIIRDNVLYNNMNLVPTAGICKKRS